MSIVKKTNLKKKREYGTEVIAFTARISKPAYEFMEVYASETKQSLGLALEELISKAAAQIKINSKGDF